MNLEQQDDFQLSENAKQKKREYAKQWREKNRDKVKASNKRYWEKKAQG